MVGAANSDSERISFFGSTKGELAQKLDRGQDAAETSRSSNKTQMNRTVVGSATTAPAASAPLRSAPLLSLLCRCR
ncbi:hypothetical protein Hanom_Chr14g01254721 [Helianthus anomalus]